MAFFHCTFSLCLFALRLYFCLEILTENFLFLFLANLALKWQQFTLIDWEARSFFKVFCVLLLTFYCDKKLTDLNKLQMAQVFHTFLVVKLFSRKENYRKKIGQLQTKRLQLFFDFQRKTFIKELFHIRWTRCQINGFKSNKIIALDVTFQTKI